MPSLREAQFRYAKYYEAILRKVDQLYKKGTASLRQGMKIFEIDWDNIRTAQVWSKERAGEEDFARLCSLFPDAGVHILYSRQHPSERISWLEAAYAAARSLKDTEMPIHRRTWMHDCSGEYKPSPLCAW